MQLLYRINRTGPTVVVATHDHAMVDRMRRRVIELSKGVIIRDELAGGYRKGEQEESTAEFAALMRGEPAPAPQRLDGDDPGDLFDSAFWGEGK
jgi:cell division transport system ATP-binding protein